MVDLYGGEDKELIIEAWNEFDKSDDRHVKIQTQQREIMWWLGNEIRYRQKYGQSQNM